MNISLADCYISNRSHHGVVQPKTCMNQCLYDFENSHLISGHFFRHSLCHVVEALIGIEFYGSVLYCLSESVLWTDHDGPSD